MKYIEGQLLLYW